MKRSEKSPVKKYKEFFDKLRSSRKDFRQYNELLNQRRYKKWENLAGDHLSQLLSSREAAEESLGHSDACMRQAAIDILSHRWDATDDEAFKAKIEELAFSDPDLQVRTEALWSLCKSYDETDDVRIGILLAQTVYNEDEPYECRWIAYNGLYKLRGVQMPHVPDYYKHTKTRPNISERVDWSFVDSFLVPDRIASPRDRFEAFPEAVREYWRSWFRGTNAFDNGAFEAAVRHITAALEGMPNRAEWFSKRAQAHMKLENWDAAIDDLSRSINIAPGFAEKHYLRSEAYKKKGLKALAVQDRKKAEDIERMDVL